MCLAGMDDELAQMFDTQRDAVDDCASGVVVHVREVIEP